MLRRRRSPNVKTHSDNRISDYVCLNGFTANEQSINERVRKVELPPAKAIPTVRMHLRND
jgi:hypothetical protein